MKLLIINGSPRIGGSTEILAQQFERGFGSVIPEVDAINVRLNDLDIIPCQSCGIDPSPMLCIYKDDLFPFLIQLREADMILIASPVYFDTVSAQTKLFIDRSNCFRPPRFDGKKMRFDEKGILNSRGAYILVGGEREKFDAAERVIGGFFIWAGIEKIGRLIYGHAESRLGAVESNSAVLTESFELGAAAARKIASGV